MPLHPREILATEDRLTWPSSWVTSFSLPHDSLEVGERGFGQVVTQLHQLTGLITPACDRYVQYLFMGVNPSVLNRHSRGYSLEDTSFPHTTYRPSQPTVLHLPPVGPARSQVIQSQHNLLVIWCETPNADPWSFDHSVSSETYVYT
jgi:hypothetical protein